MSLLKNLNIDTLSDTEIISLFSKMKTSYKLDMKSPTLNNTQEFRIFIKELQSIEEEPDITWKDFIKTTTPDMISNLTQEEIVDIYKKIKGILPYNAPKSPTHFKKYLIDELKLERMFLPQSQISQTSVVSQTSYSKRDKEPRSGSKNAKCSTDPNALQMCNNNEFCSLDDNRCYETLPFTDETYGKVGSHSQDTINQWKLRLAEYEQSLIQTSTGIIPPVNIPQRTVYTSAFREQVLQETQIGRLKDLAKKANMTAIDFQGDNKSISKFSMKDFNTLKSLLLAKINANRCNITERPFKGCPSPFVCDADTGDCVKENNIKNIKHINGYKVFGSDIAIKTLEDKMLNDKDNPYQKIEEKIQQSPSIQKEDISYKGVKLSKVNLDLLGKDLQEICIKLGLPKTGVKSVLVDRIRTFIKDMNKEKEIRKSVSPVRVSPVRVSPVRVSPVRSPVRVSPVRVSSPVISPNDITKDLKVAELKEIAQELDIKSPGKLKKELISSIKKELRKSPSPTRYTSPPRMLASPSLLKNSMYPTLPTPETINVIAETLQKDPDVIKKRIQKCIGLVI